VLGADVPAEIAQRARKQCHQLVSAVLTERRRDGLRFDLRQLRRTPRTLCLESLPEPDRNREVARAASSLAERRKPARAEVDGVQREPECGQLLAVAAGQMRLGISGGRGGVQQQAGGISVDRVVLDPDLRRPLGDGGACLTEVSHRAENDARGTWATPPRTLP
jgi:hypothetical protein